MDENNIKNLFDEINDKEKYNYYKLKKKKVLMRGYLFFKFNKIVQGENYDESLYDDPEYQMFLNLEKN